MFHNEIHPEGREIAEETTIADMGPPERVLQVPELLELICMHLPALDVLVYQRVSKMWQSTIQCSGSLQEKLFFKASVPRSNNDHTRIFKPPGFAWNPFLLEFGNWGYRSMYLEIRILRLKDYDSASWKKMFVVSPTDYPIFVVREHAFSRKPTRNRLEDPEGARMSQIADLETKTAENPGLAGYIELGAMYSRATKKVDRKI